MNVNYCCPSGAKSPDEHIYLILIFTLHYIKREYLILFMLITLNIGAYPTDSEHQCEGFAQQRQPH